MNDSLKWDMLDCYYPWRSFVADCVRFKIFPLWNPYQHFGYPIFADLRSVFYPEPWIVGLFGGYSMRWFHSLFVFYLAMAGWGMYTLTGNFSRQQISRVIVAMAYVMCGYFVGHAQDLGVMVSGAWMPWSLHYFLKLQKELRWKRVWPLVLFMFLHLTGGYHALNIIYVYLLLLIGFSTVIERVSSGEKQALFKQMRLNSVAGILALIAIGTLIVSYLQGAPHVGRLTGLTLKEAYVGMLKPFALSSLIVPFSATSWEGLAETDVSMSNVYVGLVTLVFFLIGLRSKKPLSLKLILMFGAICLLASLGPSTPVRKFLFDFVPGMNLFRMSSYFSYFTQVAVLLTAAVGFDRVIEKPIANQKAFRFGVYLLLLITFGLGFYAYTRWPTAGLIALENISNLNSDELKLNWNQRVVAHAAIQIIFLLLLFLSWIALKKNRLVGQFGLLLVVLAELMVATKLNHKTTIGGGFDPIELQSRVDNLPQGFTAPDQGTSMQWIRDSRPPTSIFPLYRNTSMMSRNISADGYNSFTLARFDALNDNHELLARALIKPFVYCGSDSSEIRLTDFNPNLFQFNIHAKEADSITLQQTYFPGWKVEVNGDAQQPHLALDAFPTVAIPKGQNTVVFRYDNSRIKLVFWVSMVVLGVCLFLMLYNGLLSADWAKSSSVTGAVICILVLGSTISFLNARNTPFPAFKMEKYQQLLERISNIENWQKAQLVIQVDDEKLMDSLLLEHEFEGKAVYGWRAGGLALKNVSEIQAETIIHAGWNEPKNERLGLLLDEKLAETYREVFENGFIAIHDSASNLNPVFERFNGFENSAEDSSVVRFSGSKSRVISDEQNGSTALEVILTQEYLKEPMTFVFKVMCLVPARRTGSTSMYLQIEREGERIWHTTTELNHLAKGYEHWFPAVLIAEPKIELKPNDVLKAYVWGSGTEPIHIDDMHLTAYRTAQLKVPSYE
jgi:hypothetical protein